MVSLKDGRGILESLVRVPRRDRSGASTRIAVESGRAKKMLKYKGDANEREVVSTNM